MRRLSLNGKILLAVLMGAVIGFLLNGEAAWAGREPLLYASKLVGTLFLDLLKMVLVPLVFSSIVSGVANLQAHHAMHRVWKVTLAFFLGSMGLAIVVGFAASEVFQPGAGQTLPMFTEAMAQHTAQTMSVKEYVVHFLHGMFQNPFKALSQDNIMAVVVIALFFGIALVVGGERYRQLREGIRELQELCLMVVGWIMHLAPLGIGALILQLVATQNAALFGTLLKFIVVVQGTTLFHGIVILPLILYLATGMKPWRFWLGAREALLTAFATSSSSATLPVTLRCVEQHLHVKKEIADFVIPLGATGNMDGTALYEATAALFVARLAGVELDLAHQFTIFFVAMLGAMGAPGIPSVGMLSMVLVLQSVGLPTEAIAILLPIDRLLDTVRTAVNVEGDMIGSLIVQRFSEPSGRREGPPAQA